MAGQPPLPQDSSLYVEANNDTRSRLTFNERQKYDFYSYSVLGSLSYFNFWGRDKFYARIDPYGNALVVDESRLGQCRHAEGAVFALDFVAHAWRDYSEKMRLLAASEKIYRDSPYASPTAVAGWTSVRSAYEEYLAATVFPAFLSYVTPPIEREIKNFSSFLKVFADFSSQVIGSAGPITLAGFVESTYSSPRNSGLVIEIADEDHSADYQKVKKYLMDKNYTIASNVASQYGFSFDKNAPWRLVANMASPAMQEYMLGVFLLPEFVDSRNTVDDCDNVIERTPTASEEPYGYSTIPGFTGVLRHAPGFDFYRSNFETGAGTTITPERAYKKLCEIGYSGVWLEDMDLLKINLLNFYNAYVTKTPVTAVPGEGLDNCGTYSFRRRPAPLVTIDNEVGVFGNKWNLRSYYNLRALEMGLDISPKEAAQDIQSVINLYNHSQGDGDYRYMRALRKVQQLVGANGNLNAVPYNNITLGDMMGW